MAHIPREAKLNLDHRSPYSRSETLKMLILRFLPYGKPASCITLGDQPWEGNPGSRFPRMQAVESAHSGPIDTSHPFLCLMDYNPMIWWTDSPTARSSARLDWKMHWYAGTLSPPPTKNDNIIWLELLWDACLELSCKALHITYYYSTWRVLDFFHQWWYSSQKYQKRK